MRSANALARSSQLLQALVISSFAEIFVAADGEDYLITLAAWPHNHIKRLTVSFYFSGAGSSVGGTFRFGHIHWTSSGNTVTFVIETAFKRNVQSSYFKGSASDKLAQVLSSFFYMCKGVQYFTAAPSGRRCRYIVWSRLANI